MVHGEGGQIALNVRFLGEALNAIKTPQIAIETQTPQNPASSSRSAPMGICIS